MGTLAGRALACSLAYLPDCFHISAFFPVNIRARRHFAKGREKSEPWAMMTCITRAHVGHPAELSCSRLPDRQTAPFLPHTLWCVMCEGCRRRRRPLLVMRGGEQAGAGTWREAAYALTKYRNCATQDGSRRGAIKRRAGGADHLLVRLF